jgi:hypothetical protein
MRAWQEGPGSIAVAVRMPRGGKMRADWGAVMQPHGEVVLKPMATGSVGVTVVEASAK